MKSRKRTLPAPKKPPGWTNVRNESNVAEFAKRRGVKNAYQLHLLTEGQITNPRAAQLWRGTAKFNLRDVDILCNVLFCRIEDLFQTTTTELQITV